MIITSSRWLLLATLAAVLIGSPAVRAQDDDDDAAPRAAASNPAPVQDDDDEKRAAVAADAAIPPLTSAQHDAVGIVVAHPQAATRALAVEAFGEVVDPAAIVADIGQLEAATAVEHAADAEVTRLGALYRSDSAASLKVLESARAEAVRAKTQAASAKASTRSHWGSLATMPAAKRQALLDAALDGRVCLVRAVLPGRQSFAAMPTKAVLEVDGLSVPALVLGTLPIGAAESQGVNLLLRVDSVPAGLGIGARMPVKVAGDAQSGFLLPASALVYDDKGAHVYRQLVSDKQGSSTRYEAVKVRLLQHAGAAWLVSGVVAGDAVVVDGVGALWSLAARDAIDNDDDD